MESLYFSIRKFSLLTPILLLALTFAKALKQSTDAGKTSTTIFKCSSSSAIDFSNKLEDFTQQVRLYGTDGRTLITSVFRLEPSNIPGCRRDTTFLAENATFTRHGMVGRMEQALNSSEPMWAWYSSKEYCINIVPGIQEWSIQLLDCGKKKFKSSILDDVPRIHITKCCPPGYALARAAPPTLESNDSSTPSTAGPKCTDAAQEWKPVFYDSESVNTRRCVQPSPASQIPLYRIVTHMEHQNILSAESAEKKRFGYFPLPRKALRDSSGRISESRSRWRILNNGTFVYYKPSNNRWHLRGTWQKFELLCVDAVILYAEKDTTEIAFELISFEEEGEYRAGVGNNTLPDPGNQTSLEDPNEIIYEADVDDVSEAFPPPSTEAILYVVFFYCSLVPLTLTILAYCLTWKTQNIHGWTVLSHLVCLACLNLFLGLSHHLPMYNYIENIPGCVFVGVVIVFFFLASFMWLTMINFDLWWTFRVLSARGNGKSLFRYIVYSTLSFGIPLVFVATGYTLDVTYGEFGYDSDCDILFPSFGVNRCYMEPNAQGIFVYYPLLLLLCLNLIFFVLTVSKIYSVKSSTKQVLKNKSAMDRSSLTLFSKLFLVMGVSCVFEFISWFSQPELANVKDIPIFFLIVDYFNIFARAIGIFLIFGCKKQVLEEIRKILASLGFIDMPEAKPSTSGTLSTSQNTVRMNNLGTIKRQTEVKE